MNTIESKNHYFKNKKVLVVEDNTINQKLALAVLADFGIDASVAINGRDAIEKLNHNKFDLILMDIQMPVMDGYTTSDIIRKKISKEIPIIAMTAHAFSGEKEKCLSHGMNDCISKPFSENVLLGKLIYYFDHVKSIDTDDHQKPDIIDLSYLSKLSNNNIDFIKEIISTFINEVPSMLTKLYEAIKNSDLKNVRILCHSLRSDFATLGAMEPVRLIDEIEEAAVKQEETFEYLNTHSKLNFMYSQIEKSVNNYIVNRL